MTVSTRAAGWGALACFVLFVVLITVSLLGVGHWWSLVVFVVSVMAGTLAVCLTVAFGVAWVSEAVSPDR